MIEISLSNATNPSRMHSAEPVDANGNSPFNPGLQQLLDGFRAAQLNALPVSFVADTYRQLLSVAEPEPNVGVGSPEQPYATMGGNELTLASALEENEKSVLRYGCAPPGQS